MPWNPETYLSFASERTQPALDLVTRITLPEPRRIIDLGCGPGNSTQLLQQRWPTAEITGLDNSPEMLATARKAHPTWRWVQGDTAEWTSPTPYDLIFSNAALQWVPRHTEVLPRLLQQVTANGALAVQMPATYHAPVHGLMRDLAKDPAWRDRLRPATRAVLVEKPPFYYDLFSQLVSRLDIWETEYIHALDQHEGIVDWMRGTGLRPYLEALASDDQRTRFESLLLDEIRRVYPRQRDGRVLFPFRRLFFIAYR